MKTRRSFIQNGSLATVALLTIKPFQSFSNTVKKITGYTLKNKKVILLHSGTQKKHFQYNIEKINKIQNNTANVLLVENGNTKMPLQFDVLTNFDKIANKSFNIVFKGDIKIGVVKAFAGQKNALINTNKIASHLKEIEKCHLVICISALGFKNKVAIDDIKLAQRSNNIDIIIGNNLANYTTYPFIAQNNAKQEVIIQASTNNDFGLSNIEIEFDELHTKKSIAINNLLTRIIG